MQFWVSDLDLEVGMLAVGLEEYFFIRDYNQSGFLRVRVSECHGF